MSSRWSVKATAERLLDQAANNVEQLKNKGCQPHLAVILVGEDPASHVYVQHKVAACEKLGIQSTFKNLPESTTQENLVAAVHQLNQDSSVHGILVQLPLPDHLDDRSVIHAIDPKKDVDGFHPINVGLLSLGEDALFPCTPMGVIELLKDADTELKGKHAVIVGRSNIVGKPMAQLLLRQNCTVSIIHSRTQNPQELCRQADIVVVAVGRTGLVDRDWLKPGALVVDIGINQITDKDQAVRLLGEGSKRLANFEKRGRALYGDVNYKSACEVAEKVTPVPGGIGKLTIAHLMLNCTIAAERNLAP